MGEGPGAQSTVVHCTVQGFNAGIELLGLGGFLIADTVVTNNQDGITVNPFTVATLDHVVLSFNKGVGASAHGTSGGAASITAVDTVATQNGTGFSLSGRFANLFLAHSTVIGNAVGIDISGPTGGASFGDNHIKFNGTDVQGGTLTNVGTQ
jgi:hypothetical protein